MWCGFYIYQYLVIKFALNGENLKNNCKKIKKHLHVDSNKNIITNALEEWVFSSVG